MSPPRNHSTRKNGRDPERIYLAAFGKHPGWDDHIDDVGLETEALVALKRMLYVQGIAGNIDAGAWDKLPESQQLGGFEHLFCRVAGPTILIGRLWSSRDGKGRARYPMVLCAQCQDLSLAWVLANVAPALESLEQRCKSVTTAPEVLSAVAQTLGPLRAKAEAADEAEPVAPIDAARMGQLTARTEMGSAREGLHRILYQLCRSGGGDGHAKSHVRVPWCGASAAQAAATWLALLRSTNHVEGAFFVAPQQPWADLFINGEPDVRDLFCLRAMPEALPPASDVPYNLDEAFVQQANAVIDNLLAGKPIDTDSPLRCSSNQSAAAAAAFARAATKTPSASPEEVAGRRRKIVRWLLAGVLALAALAALGFGLKKAMESGPAATPDRGQNTPGPQFDSKSWQSFCRAYNDWFGRLVTDMTGDRRQRWKQDEELAAAIAPLERAAAEGFRFDPRVIAATPGVSMRDLMESPPESVRSPEVQGKIRRCLEAVAKVEDALSGKGWKAMAALRAFAKTARDNGWTGSAEYAESLLSAAAPARGARIAEAVDAVLEAAPAAGGAQGAWRQLQQDLARIARSPDPVLKRFGPFVESRIRAGAGVADKEGLRRLHETLDRQGGSGSLAAELAGFAGGDYKKVDTVLLASDPPAGLPAEAAQLGEEHFRNYLAALRSGRYDRLDAAADPRAGWKAKEQLDAARADVSKLAAFDKARADALARELEALQADVSAVQALTFNRRTRVEVEGRFKAAEAALGAKTSQVALALTDASGSLETFVSALPKTLTGSPALGGLWQKRCAELVAGVKDLPTLKVRVRAARAGIEQLDAQMPAAVLPESRGGERHNRMLAELGRRREEALAEAAAAVAWGPDGTIHAGEPFASVWSRARQKQQDFQGQVAALAVEVDAIAAGFRAMYLLEETPPGASTTLDKACQAVMDKPILQDPAIRKAGAEFLARVEDLRAIAGMPRAQLIERANAPGGRGLLTLAIWRRLGAVGPAWPADAEELRREVAIRKNLQAALTALPEPARREALQKELDEQAARRWQTCLNAAVPAQTQAVIALGTDCGVNAQTPLPLLAGHARFNLLLHEWSGTARALKDETAIRQEIARFRQKASALPADTLKRAEVAAFLAELDAMAQTTAQAGGDVSKAALAASTVKNYCQTETFEDGKRVRYSLELAKGRKHMLEFVRLETPEGLPTYLCTTEVSVGLFLDVISAGEKWAEMTVLMKGLLRDEEWRAGPRTWQWAPQSRSPQRAGEWLFNPSGEQDLYPEGLSAPAPVADSPVQYIPPQAAVYFASLLGCRLPTAAQWQQAWAIEKARPEPAWNLRDKTWARQKEHAQTRVKQGRAVPAQPDAEIFRPAQATETPGPAVAYNDGVLWFAPVGADAGRVFHHLVGNVWELVVEDVNMMDPAAGEMEPQAVKELVDKKFDAVGVIGGSALSPGSLKVDQRYGADLKDSANGYCDVGLRLAFRAPGESLASRLKRVLDRRGYLPPSGGSS